MSRACKGEILKLDPKPQTTDQKKVLKLKP